MPCWRMGNIFWARKWLSWRRSWRRFAVPTHCVSVSSGTDALQIALMAEGIGRGDAVFLPAFTYTATAEVPLLLGATPVFVDVDPRSFQIDLASLEARIADVKRAGVLRPRAVIGVDLFGQPADWPMACARLRRARACSRWMTARRALARHFAGERLGKAADATATSFFPSKPLGAYGDGGALFTESAERAALYRSLRTHGEGTTRYEVMRIGMNGRLDTMQAAVLLAKLEVFEARDRSAARRSRGFMMRHWPVWWKRRRACRKASAPGRCIPCCCATRLTRNAAQAALKAAGIASAVYYPRALHQQPAYAACHDGVALPVAEGLGQSHHGAADPPGFDAMRRRRAWRPCCARQWPTDMPRGDLFPEIGPFETGYLPLSDGHVMYWEQVGNPRGKPVLFLHGGPGAGAGAVHRRFFDPEYLAGDYFRPARRRTLQAAGQPGCEHDAASGGRHRDAAEIFGHGAAAAVRRLLGLDAGFGLCAGASRKR